MECKFLGVCGSCGKLWVQGLFAAPASCIREARSPPLLRLLSIIHSYSTNKHWRLVDYSLQDNFTKTFCRLLTLHLIKTLLLCDIASYTTLSYYNHNHINTQPPSTSTHKHFSQWVPSYLVSRPSSEPSAVSLWQLSPALETCSPQ